MTNRRLVRGGPRTSLLHAQVMLTSDETAMQWSADHRGPRGRTCGSQGRTCGNQGRVHPGVQSVQATPEAPERYGRRVNLARLMKDEMSRLAGFEPEPDPADTAFGRLAVDLGLAVAWAGPIRRRVNAAVAKPGPAGQARRAGQAVAVSDRPPPLGSFPMGRRCG